VPMATLGSPTLAQERLGFGSAPSHGRVTAYRCWARGRRLPGVNCSAGRLYGPLARAGGRGAAAAAGTSCLAAPGRGSSAAESAAGAAGSGENTNASHAAGRCAVCADSGPSRRGDQ